VPARGQATLKAADYLGAFTAAINWAAVRLPPRPSSAMIRQMPPVVPLATASLRSTQHPPRSRNIKLFGEKEIRGTVTGKDITDRSHWSIYLRSDGVVLIEKHQTN